MMTPNEIKAELVRRGIKQKDVIPLVKSEKTDIVKLKTVNIVINGHQRSRPIQRAVADLLGIPYEEIWGKAA
jgi:lambda repressor-like predicted transcriptional regulator